MRDGTIRRRDFISLLGGAATAWPLAAYAQQPGPVRRVGVLMNLAADDPESTARLDGFRQGLRDLGWIEGRNLQLDCRWGGADAELYRKYTAELLALGAEVVVATAGPIVRALQQATTTVPIVFTTTIDPVGLGYVASLAQPGGNTTGVAYVGYGLSGKWLELLKQIERRVSRAVILHDPTVTAGRVQFAEMQSVAPSLGMELSAVDVRDVSARERAVAEHAREPTGGLILTAGTYGTMHRDDIVALAAQYRLPAVYPNRFYVLSGGLISYGPHFVDQYQRAAGYVDRILKGAKPADLPVQAPTRYQTVLNITTAKALGLTVPRLVLARIDEFIE
jgi:putative ABC transport system substrate-binding protein